MQALREEFEHIRANGFELRFRIPTEEERRDLRQLHRDRSAAESAARREALRSVESTITALERGDIDMEDLPNGLRRKLEALTRTPEEP